MKPSLHIVVDCEVSHCNETTSAQRQPAGASQQAVAHSPFCEWSIVHFVPSQHVAALLPVVPDMGVRSVRASAPIYNGDKGVIRAAISV